MAQIQNKTFDTNTRRGCFQGCFGFSAQVSDKMSPEKVGLANRKKTRWLSWSRLRSKKSGTKTVPVDATLSEKTSQVIENRSSTKPKSKSKPDKLAPKLQIPSTGPKRPGRQIPAAVSDQNAIENTQKTKYGPEQSSILENRNNLDHLESAKNDTCQKRLSFSRKIEAIRTGPGSPETKPKSGSTAAVMSPAISSPARNRDKRAANMPPIHSASMVKKSDGKNVAQVGKLDPMVGMSIIMVTLIIMLLWGRLCAILCTSAWFYFIPRIWASVKSNGTTQNKSNSDDVDINSEEYKKKVVLDGFLERNHRSPFGIL
ncbi:hypothetical protein L1049_022873 [Liquidambar formosana]|uniref:Uncharacterized protein n=1 Tax=Liquidambar formosana TaxID=63359 RepID=A0AAP0WQV7_LIQFO